MVLHIGKFVVSAAVLLLVFNEVDLKGAFVQLGSFPTDVLAVLGAVAFVIFFLCFFRWMVFVRKIGNRTTARLLQIFWASDFVSLLGISLVSSEVYKYLAFENDRRAIVLSLSDRVFSMLWNGFLIVAAALSLAVANGNLLVLAGAFAVFVALFGAGWGIVHKRFFARKFPFLSPFGAAEYVAHVALNTLYVVVLSVGYAYLFRHVGIFMSAAELLLFVPLMIVVVSLPISFQGFGVREYFFLLYTAGSGVSTEVIIAASFLVYLSSLAMSLLGVVPFLVRGKRKHSSGTAHGRDSGVATSANVLR